MNAINKVVLSRVITAWIRAHPQQGCYQLSATITDKFMQ